MDLSPAGPASIRKTRYITAAIVAVLVVAAAATGFAWADRTSVFLVVDGVRTEYETEAVDVSALLAQAGVEVTDGDLVNPGSDAPLEDGVTVTVRHATPVTIVLVDEALEVDVIGTTVADALVSAGLDPESGVTVDPPIDTPLEPGLVITATDVFLRVVEEEVEVPFETETIDDSGMLRGAREVRTEGVPGRKLRIFEVVVVGGDEGARVLKAERVLEKPVAEIVAVGTKRPPSRQLVASRGTQRQTSPAPVTGKEFSVVASAYTPGVGCGYSTATGRKAGYGVVAVDPSVFPLGTRLYIPGYGYGIAADTGGSIGGTRIDLCFDTLSEALAWGRRTVTVTVVD